MDESTLRRGQPCWFRNPKVKMIAINDAFLLETFVFQILKKHFRTEPIYMQLVEIFHDVSVAPLPALGWVVAFLRLILDDCRQVIYRTELGQLLDLTSQPLDAEPDLARFTPER